MSWLHAIRHRLRALVNPRAYDRDLDEEFAFHVELDALQRDEPRERAIAQARRRFGRQSYHKEETRRMTALGLLDVVGQDIRFGWRTLRARPVFAAIAIGSLALGIGVTTSIFSLLYAALLEPLHVRNASQLVALERVSGKRRLSFGAFGQAEFDELRAAPGAPELTAYTMFGNTAIEADGKHDAIRVELVEPSFFSTIGLGVEAGRVLGPDDERTSSSVVVISDRLWTKYFNRAPSTVGSVITLNGQRFTIVGITPKDFAGLEFPGVFDAAAPLGAGSLLMPATGRPSRPPMLTIVGRLPAAASLEATNAGIDRAYQRCCASGQLAGVRGWPDSHAAFVDASRGIVISKVNLRADYGRILAILMAGVSVVLLIACANVGSLLLAQASARRREFAVRLSLGASRARIVRQLLTESIQLAIGGAVLGLLLSAWMTNALVHEMPRSLAMFNEILTFRMKPELLLFTVLVTIGCTLVFGLVPALRATRTDLATPLRDGAEATGGRPVGIVDRGIVVAQVALALLLVSCAGSLGATLRNLRNVNAGFATSNILMVQVDTRDTPFERDGIVPIHREILDRARALPGVQMAAMSTTTPVWGGRWSAESIDVPGYTPRPDDDMEIALNAVTPGYFATAGIAMDAGRDFQDGDGPDDALVTVIGESVATRFFPGRDPLGLTIRVGDPNPLTLRIIGVVHDVKYRDLRGAAEPMIYVPVVQSGTWPFLAITMRTTGDPALIAQSVERAIATVHPGLPVLRPTTMAHAIDEELSRERLAAWLAGVFAAIALGMSSIGLFGVVNYGVMRRRREIGVRMALGARRPDVVWLVLRGSLSLVTLGVAAGTPLVIAGGGVIGSLLYGVGQRDPFLFAGSIVLLAAVAVAASAIPATRAARIDPLTSLRSA